MAGMSDADLAKTLARAGFIESLACQIPNFLAMATQYGIEATKESQNAAMYLERIFYVFINLAICGQHVVRKDLCSESVMGTNLTQVVHTLIISSNPTPIRYQVSKWFVKLILALTSQQTP